MNKNFWQSSSQLFPQIKYGKNRCTKSNLESVITFSEAFQIGENLSSFHKLQKSGEE